jgi:membrane protease YdiL (CAAX protease family)
VSDAGENPPGVVSLENKAIDVIHLTLFLVAQRFKSRYKYFANKRAWWHKLARNVKTRWSLVSFPLASLVEVFGSPFEVVGRGNSLKSRSAKQ